MRRDRITESTGRSCEHREHDRNVEKLRLVHALSEKIGNARLSWADASRALGVEREQLARVLVDPSREGSDRLRALVRRLAG